MNPNPSIPVTVGLDYHQDAVQVCVLDASGRTLLNRELPNEPATIIAAAQPCTG